MGVFVLQFPVNGDETRVAQMIADLDGGLNLDGLNPAQLKTVVQDAMKASCVDAVRFTEREKFQGTDEEFEAQYVPVEI